MKLYRINFDPYAIEEVEAEDLGPRKRGMNGAVCYYCQVGNAKLSYQTKPRHTGGGSGWLFTRHEDAMTSLLWEVSARRYMCQVSVNRYQELLEEAKKSLDAELTKIADSGLNPPAWEDIYKEVK